MPRGLDAGQPGRAAVVGQAHRHARPHQVDAALGRALGVVGVAQRPGVGGVVPDVDRLVPLGVAEVDERRAVGVRLAVEPEVGGEQQHRRHGPRLEDHLVAAGRQLDRVDPGPRLGRGPGAARGAVDGRDRHRGRLGEAVAAPTRWMPSTWAIVDRAAARLAARRRQGPVAAPRRAEPCGLARAIAIARGHEVGHDAGTVVGAGRGGARRPSGRRRRRAPPGRTRRSRGRPGAARPRPAPGPPARPARRRRCGWSTVRATRPSSATVSRTATLSSLTFWWMRPLAKRVSAAAPAEAVDDRLAPAADQRRACARTGPRPRRHDYVAATTAHRMPAASAADPVTLHVPFTVEARTWAATATHPASRSWRSTATTRSGTARATSSTPTSGSARCSRPTSPTRTASTTRSSPPSGRTSRSTATGRRRSRCRSSRPPSR